jgi:hypothetical protein
MADIFEVSRIGTPTNLETGATYDMLFVHTPAFPVGQIEFRLELYPRKITGIQKVAQTLLKIWLTTKGSDLLRPNHGTELNNIIQGGNTWAGDEETNNIIRDTLTDAESQTKAILNNLSSDPASKLSSVQFQGIDNQGRGNGLSIYAQVVTMAGEYGSISLPFPELDLIKANL